MPQLSIKDVTVTYGRDDYAVTPLDKFNLEVPEGTLAVLLGPSGCGKTTLLSCLSGIQRPTNGVIRFGDVEVTSMERAELGRYRRHRCRNIAWHHRTAPRRADPCHPSDLSRN